jgi:hypothetical protein
MLNGLWSRLQRRHLTARLKARPGRLRARRRTQRHSCRRAHLGGGGRHRLLRASRGVLAGWRCSNWCRWGLRHSGLSGGGGALGQRLSGTRLPRSTTRHRTRPGRRGRGRRRRRSGCGLLGRACGHVRQLHGLGLRGGRRRGAGWRVSRLGCKGRGCRRSGAGRRGLCRLHRRDGSARYGSDRLECRHRFGSGHDRRFGDTVRFRQQNSCRPPLGKAFAPQQVRWLQVPKIDQLT